MQDSKSPAPGCHLHLRACRAEWRSSPPHACRVQGVLIIPGMLIVRHTVDDRRYTAQYPHNQLTGSGRLVACLEMHHATPSAAAAGVQRCWRALLLISLASCVFTARAARVVQVVIGTVLS